MMPRSNRFLLPAVIILGSLSLLVVAILVLRGVSRPQNATPSKAAETTTDPLKCQGNKTASAKCFDCHKDGTTSQVNIIDFQCFRNAYGKAVQ